MRRPLGFAYLFGLKTYGQARSVLPDIPFSRDPTVPTDLNAVISTTKGVLSTQFSGWTRRASTTVIDLVSPITDTFLGTAVSASPDSRLCQNRGRSARSASVNTTSLMYPQIGSPAPNRDQYRRTSSPQLPLGEHSAAARSRARAKIERRMTRRCQRLHSTGSLRSSRPRNPFDADRPVQEEETQEETFEEQIKRSSVSRTSCSSMLAILRNIDHEDGRQQPHKDILETTKMWQRSRKNSPASGQSNNKVDESKSAVFNARLATAKIFFSNPSKTLTSDPSPTTSVNTIPVSRKVQDLSGASVSSSYYLWHLVIECQDPTRSTSMKEWTGTRPVSSVALSGTTKTNRCLDSTDGFYHPEMHGRRKYNRESGFWTWASYLPDNSNRS